MGATEIRVRAERRLGELLAVTEKAKGSLKRGPAVVARDRGENLMDTPADFRPVLEQRIREALLELSEWRDSIRRDLDDLRALARSTADRFLPSTPRRFVDLAVKRGEGESSDRRGG